MYTRGGTGSSGQIHTGRAGGNSTLTADDAIGFVCAHTSHIGNHRASAPSEIVGRIALRSQGNGDRFDVGFQRCSQIWPSHRFLRHLRVCERAIMHPDLADRAPSRRPGSDRRSIGLPLRADLDRHILEDIQRTFS